MADLDAGAHLRPVVAGTRAQVGGVRRRRIGQLHELHQMVERLPVGEAAGGALQAELGQDASHLLDHALHLRVRLGDDGLVDAEPAGPSPDRRAGRRSRAPAASRLPDRAASGPARKPSVSARSSTCRAITPTVSSAGDSGMAPARLMRPQVGLIEATPQQAAGSRSEPPVSEPSPAGMAP